MIDRVRTYLKQLDIGPESSLLVGCSGGPDSTALLYILQELAPEFGYRVCVACFDHGIRPETETSVEIELVRQHCDCLGVSFVSGRLPGGVVAELAVEPHGRGIEATARQQRYAFLARVAREHGCTGIALGHNRNDKYETQIQRAIQGSGPGGLVGIPARRQHYIRPLLSICRSDILTFLRNRHIDYATDPSNSDPRFLRNAVRNDLVPTLSTIFPGYARGLDTLSEKMNLVEEFLQSESERRLPVSFEEGVHRATIDRVAFSSAPGILRLYSLYRAIDLVSHSTAESPLRMPFKALRAVVSRVFDPEVKRARVLQSSGIEILLDPTDVVVRPIVVLGAEKSYLMVINEGADQVHTVRLGGVEIEASVRPLQHARENAVAVSCFPVVVRTRQPGDVVRCDGLSFPLKKLFNRWGVDPARRWRIPVVQDCTGIVAVLAKEECGEQWFCRGGRTKKHGSSSSWYDMTITLRD